MILRMEQRTLSIESQRLENWKLEQAPLWTAPCHLPTSLMCKRRDLHRRAREFPVGNASLLCTPVKTAENMSWYHDLPPMTVTKKAKVDSNYLQIDGISQVECLHCRRKQTWPGSGQDGHCGRHTAVRDLLQFPNLLGISGNNIAV